MSSSPPRKRDSETDKWDVSNTIENPLRNRFDVETYETYQPSVSEVTPAMSPLIHYRTAGGTSHSARDGAHTERILEKKEKEFVRRESMLLQSIEIQSLEIDRTKADFDAKQEKRKKKHKQHITILPNFKFGLLS